MASLKDKSSTIVIIDKSGTMRSSFSSVLRELGYNNLLSLKSIKEFIAFKNRGQTSWIVTHSYLQDSLSAFHLLRLALENPEFQNLRVTILFDESEEQYIPFAFAMGAISYHVGPLTPTVIRNQFGNVLNTINAEPDYIIAARFCREFLLRKKLLEDLVELETILLEGYDHSPEQFFRTAEAYFISGNEHKGIETLFESLVYDSGLRDQANALSQKYVGRPLADHENILQFDTCILIDSDVAVRRTLIPLIKALNFKNIVEFDDGRKALDFSRRAPNIDLIVTEWKLRELFGPTLIQILRYELDSTIPIIVCSSLLKKEDEILLQEINVNKLISKPIRPQNFLASTIHVLKQSRYPSEHISKQREIRLHLKNGEIEKAVSIFKSLNLDSGFPQGKKKLLHAEIIFAKGDYVSARDLAIQAAQIDGYDSITLSLLGKIFIHLGEHMKALQYLEKANALSPNNIERICSIAVEHAELGNNSDSQKILSTLRKEAPDAIMVKEASVKSAIKRGQHEEANAFLGSMDSSSSLVTFWNNQGISYVKQDKIEHGLNIYKRALATLPPGYSDNRSFIRYNLALAYARASQFENALLYLYVESVMPHSPVIKKVRSLYHKISVSLRDDTPLVLTGTDESEVIQPERTIGIPIETSLLPGELCLWGLYKPDKAIPEVLLKESTILTKIKNTG